VEPAVETDASQLDRRCTRTLHAASPLCTARIKHLLVVMTIPFWSPRKYDLMSDGEGAGKG
jgi:hypothetical protein